MQKRILAFVLTLVLALGSTVCVFADETENNEFEIVQTTSSEVQYAEASAPEDNDELLQEYLDLELEVSTSNAPMEAGVGEKRLTGLNLTIYNLLRAKIEQVAAGKLDDTVFELTKEELGIGGNYTAEDLGVEAIIANGEIAAEAKAAMYAKRTIDQSIIVKALLMDCPYDLYWYDKTKKTEISLPGLEAGYDESKNDYVLSYSSGITFSLPVASDYAAGTYQVNSRPQAVADAVAKAKEIVASYANVSDWEKLVGYRNEICNLVSYNDDAVADDYNQDFKNPWQLIWVFDGDESTKVVCEGYSKAFQYLCDLTDFNGEIKCLMAEGKMKGGTGEGPHMWNIVTMEDGQNYLVDVTNCDEGTVGAPDQLFLVGDTKGTGSVAAGYAIPTKSQDITYTYDNNLTTIYNETELKLATKNYEYTGLTSDDVSVAAHSLSLTGNIGINFYLKLSNKVLNDNGAKVVFTLPDQKGNTTTVEQTITADKEETLSGETVYRFQCEVASTQMTDEVSGKIVLSDGTESVPFNYAVTNYTDSYLDDNKGDSDYEKVAPLIKTMLNYGGFAQSYFKYNDNALANETLTDVEKDLSSVTAETLESYKATRTEDTEGLEYAGTSLVLRSETSIRHYFKVKNGSDISSFTFTCGNATLKPVQSGDYYYVEIPNIASSKLDEAYEVKVGTFSITYRALSYANIILNDANADAALKDLMKAMYLYNQAANTYFGN